VTEPDRAVALAHALAAAVPASRGWARDGAPDDGCTWSTLAPSLAPRGARRLDVELRPDGDVDVRLYYAAPHPATGRGPAEAHFLVDADGEAGAADALAAVARFVADLLAERLVLGLRRGWFRGGREFLALGELTAARRRTFDRVVSWRGSYDWSAARDGDPPRPPA
jgi:hypothetical protein